MNKTFGVLLRTTVIFISNRYLQCFDAKKCPHIQGSGHVLLKYKMMLYKPVLIGLGEQYFDTICATVYCFVCYQKSFTANIKVTRF